MKDVKIEYKVDDANGIISLTNSDYFTAYRISTVNRVSKLVASVKSPYRDIFSRNGIYILVEDDCKNPPKFYVGKARPFWKRFKAHCSPSQSFTQSHLHWTDGIFIVGENAKFSRWGSDEVEWFEDRLLKSIISAGNYQTTNTPSATFTGGSVDEVLCEKQLNDIKVVVGLLGYPKLFSGTKMAKSFQTSIAVTKNSPVKIASKRSPNSYHGLSSVVIRALMKHLFSNGLINASDIKDFTSPASHVNFKIGSSTICTMMVDYVKHCKKIGGHVRYYPDKYSFNGKDYALSSQLYPRSVVKFLGMALAHGLTENDVAKLCPDPRLIQDFFNEIKAGNLK